MKRISRKIVVTCSLFCFTATAWGQELPPVLEPTPGLEELPPASEAILDGINQAIADAHGSPQPGAPAAEWVRERYQDGKIKIEREVVQDEDQNYINHGKWKSYDRNGQPAMEGRFKRSTMDGVWTRVYQQRENKLLNIAPFNRGQMPLVSQANFQDGKLHGKWVIFDAHKRKLCEWEFSNGKRDGVSTWWFASGLKMREITYNKGTIDGQFNEWDRTGRQVTKDKYVEGRRLEPKTEYYPDRRKRAEGTVLHPKLALEQADDWMECTLATYSLDGEPVKHGVWTSWYPNGQPKHAGQYENDIPTGEFTWWHENGQRSLVAAYTNGKKHGMWTWWHPNGLKSIQGKYAEDAPTSKWLWWQETGKVAQRADFDDPSQRNVLAMPTEVGKTVTSPSAAVPSDVIRK